MEQNLTLYKIFYQVANAGNISHAARELYISQPAVSKGIQKLETAMGIKLFLRNSRGVQLTDEGQMLYEHVKTAFDTLETAELKMKKVTELGIGHLRLGVSTTLCKYMLLPYLEGYVKQHPHIKITIECQSSHKTIELLEQNKIDIGLVGMTTPASSHQIHFQPVKEIEDVFVTTGEYLENLAKRTSIEQNSFFTEATLMLLDKENMSRQYIDEYLLAHQIEINHVLEISSMDLLIEFAKIGLGAACVIREFVARELEAGLLKEIPLHTPIHKRAVGFAYRKNGQLTQSTESFIEFYQRIG